MRFFFRSVDGFDLNSILCYKYKRTLNNDYTIVYKHQWFQLHKKQPLILYAQDKIDVHIAFDGTITFWKKGKKLAHSEIDKPIRHKEEKERIVSDRTWKSKANHPWRLGGNQVEIADISNELKRGHF